MVEGPLSTSVPICLGCHIPLIENEDPFVCPECCWPMCSLKCCDDIQHRKECKILSNDTKKIGVPNSFTDTPRYDIITVLRCLLLRDSNQEAWECLMKMESHAKTRESYREAHHIATVRYLSEVCNIDYDLETIHHIRGAIVTNGIEIRGPKGGKIRAVYPRIRLLNHSCIPNVHLTCSSIGVMEARSAVSIEKGETLLICYTGTVEPLWERQRCAIDVYHFQCRCNRCKDPTEMGTYFSSPKCSECPDRYLLPNINIPIMKWYCMCCEMEYTTSDIRQEIEEWESRIDMNDFFGSRSAKSILNKVLQVENSFHSMHFLVLRVAHKAIGHMLTDFSQEALNAKKTLWTKILSFYDVLEPGLTRRRGETVE